MLQSGILNPHLLHLLARIRHTNTLVIADWAFPFWPQIETVDLSLTHGIPSVPEVLAAIRANFTIGRIWQAEEFLDHNPDETRRAFEAATAGLPDIERLPHLTFKTLVPAAIGLVRTGDATPYANLILESA
jgi:D-ribose pyranase